MMVDSSLILAGIAAAIFGLAWYLYLSKSRQSAAKSKSSLPPLPPAGCTFVEFLSAYRRAENQQEAHDKHGKIFTIPSPIPGVVPNQVWINDPQIVKHLCVKCANQYRNPSTFTTRGAAFQTATQSVVGVGVTGLVGDEWRWRKMALLKCFHKSKLLADDRGLLEKVIEEGEGLCNALSKASETKEPMEVDLITTQAAVGVVLYFLFGRDLEFDAAEFRQSAGDLMEVLGYSFAAPFFRITKKIPGTTSYQMEQKKVKAWRIVDKVAAPEIQRLLDEYSGKLPVHPDRKPGSVLATLIADEPRFRTGGVDSMIAEARVFVQAGFETTAHSLAFSMGMMAERPDLADAMAKLGKDLMGSPETSISVPQMKDAIEKTSIVKNFFLESVRLYPLAPALGGECTDDIVIQVDSKEYGLPKGTACFFPNLLLQRHVENPETIVPARWDVASKSEEPFLHTFQNGAHSCPGKPLSLLEGHVFLLMAATRFEFEFPTGSNKVEYDDNLLLRPKNGMPLLVRKRG